ncbi:MAG: VOC family protein [Chloracidobacterium sp.]|nr:VOC family protein [Chloracidobacterium sp.]
MNLNQVTIYCENTVETAEFYEKLGLRLIVDSLPRYARLECPDGDSTLSVHEARSGRLAKPGSSRIVLYFECSDLDAEVQRLRSLGLGFDRDPEDRDWLWREAYLSDPSGNQICLFHAGVNRKNPPWRVK